MVQENVEHSLEVRVEVWGLGFSVTRLCVYMGKVRLVSETPWDDRLHSNCGETRKTRAWKRSHGWGRTGESGRWQGGRAKSEKGQMQNIMMSLLISFILFCEKSERGTKNELNEFSRYYVLFFFVHISTCSKFWDFSLNLHYLNLLKALWFQGLCAYIINPSGMCMCVHPYTCACVCVCVWCDMWGST